MSATESAGFKPATHWNSATSNTGTLSSLVAANSSTTTASITWNSPVAPGQTAAMYTVPFNDASGDAHMMNGFLEAKDTVSVTIGVTLPSSMSGGYDVYVYCYGNINAMTRTYQYAIQDATKVTAKSVSQTGPSATTFPGHAPAPAAGGTGAGTYVLFQNLTGTSFTLTATPEGSTTTPQVFRAPVNGIQVVYPSGS
jgi:hypothetical protein